MHRNTKLKVAVLVTAEDKNLRITTDAVSRHNRGIVKHRSNIEQMLGLMPGTLKKMGGIR